ncbi:hypothetical protein F3Y22_tig00004779pilonHSYRG00170 [Hibiscus syriacus]|uniref:FLZ-type domain-containing protein n=1 Tax=Hibiscus syriacus TaxID=106335 RepID=A0A6A3CFR6_HIBSY|nr:hypothetical protein F3Y22_tig00004779pilonHSYRG00170 [Hibiscus syriacus]
MSPKSILDSKPFSAFKNPFWSESNTPKPQEHETKHKLDSKGIGLTIVDSHRDDNCFDPCLSKPVLFGSQLRVQIPSLPHGVSPAESPGTPPEFSIKTRTTQLGSFSFSASEMELSEYYTCVITHGSNPRTTHIFYDFIVETCCGVVGLSSSKKENGFLGENFLSFVLLAGRIFLQEKTSTYTGEKAFCSKECRYQEMMLDEGADKPESDYR